MPELEVGSYGAATITGLRGWDGWTFEIKPAARSVTVTSPEGERVTPERWRKIPIGTVFKIAQMAHSNPVVAVIAAGVGEFTPRPHGGSPEHDERVAALYRAALEAQVSPAAVIAHHYGQHGVKTAQRWIAELRHKGVLKSYAEERAALSLEEITGNEEEE